MSPAQFHRLLFALCLLGLALRGLVAWQRSGELGEDRDAYLGIAASLRDGRGYSTPGSTQPTAYRPPLYPLLLAASPFPDVDVRVAVVNLACGAATVWLTGVLGLRLGLSPVCAALAALLVAIDPLLVRYASQPMTESLCTLLVAGLLLACDVERLHQSLWRSAIAGLLFGLCALCRPTVWSFAAMMLAWGLMELICLGLGRRRSIATECPPAFDTDPRRVLLRTALGLLGCLVVVGPWVLRNQRALGAPVLTTTHGGYTLLLGNNPAFYAEVVRQPWGTVWDGSRGPGQQAWAESIERELLRQQVQGEVARDHWMSARAWESMRADPAGCARASLLRLTRFWHVAPSGPAAEGWPTPLLLGVAVFYLVQWGAVIVGGLGALRSRDVRWGPLLLLIAGFTVVHLLYWSNVRMRAPLVPALALLAARGGCAAGDWLAARRRRRVNAA